MIRNWLALKTTKVQAHMTATLSPKKQKTSVISYLYKPTDVNYQDKHIHGYKILNNWQILYRFPNLFLSWCIYPHTQTTRTDCFGNL